MHSIVPKAAAAGFLPLALIAYKDGPPPHSAGGFGDETCLSCHLDNPLNAPGGSLTVTGPPPSYTPGATYRVTITLAREDLRRGGFQMAARFEMGDQEGKQAGSWRLLDQRVQMAESGMFVQHTGAGTLAPAPGSTRWTVEWSAPPERAGPVVFNVAANASNDDASALGDFIYTADVHSRPQN